MRTNLLSDEELAQAAEQFIEADLARREAKRARSAFYADEDNKCLVLRTSEPPPNGEEDHRRRCWQLFHDGAITWADFCEPCVERHHLYNKVKMTSAKYNGKLRRLRNLVKKRKENLG